ncbi:MAG: shikimate dehydrogenase family protein [Alphaproteobacteria bacterium]
MAEFLLGLIGDNIQESRAPELHRIAGALTGHTVQYDLLVPAKLEATFDAVFASCDSNHRHGVNVTLPYKERAAAMVQIDDPLAQAIGAVNTVIFTEGRPQGFNTDYSGFIAAYKGCMGDAPPGPVCLIGAGGVGKAIAFGLIALGSKDIRFIEKDLPKAEALASTLRQVGQGLDIRVFSDPVAAVAGANGLVNCTPMGMTGYGGTPLEPALMTEATWAFDAVYTPMNTTFLSDAKAAGLTPISGYELFIHQGIHAFERFTGAIVEEAALRHALATG